MPVRCPSPVALFNDNLVEAGQVFHAHPLLAFCSIFFPFRYTPFVMNEMDDTIAAIATASGEGSVSIVRVSGVRSFEIADAVFRGLDPKPSARSSHVVLHGHVAGDAADIDEVLLVLMRGPHSYTGEDVIEIQGHGGTVTARRILRRVLDAGARPAEPGEFTKRAFLNGRLDLVQAEAVLDLVRARSDRAAAAAIEQLEGTLSQQFGRLYDELLAIAADIEASLDFADDELPTAGAADFLARLSGARRHIEDFLSTWDEGHMLREGILVVISGRPNVGKSTLLNCLLGRPRAIVSQLPGTTRDTIEESLVIGGIPVRLVDTAGLREATGEVEREGIRRTMEHMEKADLHVYMVDASQPLSAEDRAHLEALKSEPCIVVLNKSDLGVAVRPSDLTYKSCVSTSLIHDGADPVRWILRTGIEAVTASTPPHAVISERHRRLLLDACREVTRTTDLLVQKGESAWVPAANCLRAAIEAIGMITGRVYHDELLSSIFSRFCVGK
jgi:tRNA modification GTPase